MMSAYEITFAALCDEEDDEGHDNDKEQTYDRNEPNLQRGPAGLFFLSVVVGHGLLSLWGGL